MCYLEAEAHDKKPTIIMDYNRAKGGVDNLDKVFYFIFSYFQHFYLLFLY